ncbi:hypothetical protein ACFL6E_01900 [Candidatus Neomarinimicrobiota bacterium]
MFDSPLFWIFLIWWLLSAVAGNKKRKAKLQASMADELVDKPDITPEVDIQHPDEQPLTVPQFLEELKPHEPERPPALAEIMRGLGLFPDQPIAPVIVPEVEVLEPEPEPLQEEVEEVAFEGSPAVAREEPATVHQSRDPLNRFACLPPLQRAIVLKEVLDRPKALRRSGLF